MDPKEKLRRIKKALVYYGEGLFNRINSRNVFLIGGGLTFSFITCIIPFVLIVFSILGKLLEIPEVDHQINAFIENAIPYQEPAQAVKSIVSARISEFKHFRTLAGYLGVVGLFFAASGLVGSLRTILNSIFGVGKNKNIFIAKLRDLGIIFVVGILFLFSIVLIPVTEIIRNLTDKIWFLQILNIGFLKHLYLSLISFLMILGIFYFIYYVIPYKKLDKKTLFISAFCAAFLWEIVKQLFGLYLAYSANLSQIYGAYVFMVAVLFWLFYSSVVVIIGAEIGQLHLERVINRTDAQKSDPFRQDHGEQDNAKII
jgi:membrane protein